MSPAGAARGLARGGATGAELLAGLGACREQACAVVDGLPVADLRRERTIQRRRRESGLSAVLHVREHSAGHAGQI
jgi:hypothetical protein